MSTNGGIDSITFDASHSASLARFWCEVLPEYEIAPYDDDEIAKLKSMGIDDVEDDPSVMALRKDGGGPRLFFTKVPEVRTAKSRVHLDVTLRDRAHFDRLIELGATLVREWDDHKGYWMTDPQGNDFCVYVP
jgi:hypothetical protein